MTRLAALFVVLFHWFAPAAAAQDGITVFAAASLRGALDEIAADAPMPVALSFGGSGTMARQIAAGAPADVVMLASAEWMDWLVEQGSVDPGRIVEVVANRLVLIGPAGAAPLEDPAQLSKRLGEARLAMGHHRAVPAGSYAWQWLVKAGLWDALSSRLAETDNVRAALALVARGQSPLGIVYASDAAAEPAVSVLWQVPPDDHDPILYPAAALTSEGEPFLELLTGAGGVFARHGFLPVRR